MAARRASVSTGDITRWVTRPRLAFLPQILALDSDDHLLVATQTIPAAKLMELAKGSTWTIRKKGTHLFSDWDWTLTMESWGCSTNGTP